MTGVVSVAIGLAEAGTLVVLDAERRTYAGLSRDGSYWHLLRPARPDDPPVGDGVMAVGELLCSCAGGRYGRRCYWTKTAEAFDAGGRPDPDVPWLDAAPGELERAWGR